jgi:hypothetical protein
MQVGNPDRTASASPQISADPLASSATKGDGEMVSAGEAMHATIASKDVRNLYMPGSAELRRPAFLLTV